MLFRSESMAVEALRPAELLRTAVERIEPLVEARGAHVAWACEEDLPEIAGDRARVLEVLSNLLDNAAKFAPAGSAVRAWAERDASGLVRFEVRDAGPGILPGDRARVFERFYTGDRARGSGGGTGLGLAIARHIIGRLGGRIWVADRSPGTTICFTLPVVAPVDAGAEGDGTSPAAEGAAGEA